MFYFMLAMYTCGWPIALAMLDLLVARGALDPVRLSTTRFGLLLALWPLFSLVVLAYVIRYSDFWPEMLCRTKATFDGRKP